MISSFVFPSPSLSNWPGATKPGSSIIHLEPEGFAPQNFYGLAVYQTASPSKWMMILDFLTSSHFRHSLLSIYSSLWLQRWTQRAHTTSCCVSRFTRGFTKVKLWADGWNYNQVTQIRRKPEIRNSNLCGLESCLKDWGYSAPKMAITWGA